MGSVIADTADARLRFWQRQVAALKADRARLAGVAGEQAQRERAEIEIRLAEARRQRRCACTLAWRQKHPGYWETYAVGYRALKRARKARQAAKAAAEQQQPVHAPRDRLAERLRSAA
jgi:hypothetical protein